jgi:glycosyltransferase involved in cell wall biosynthesis
LPAAVRDQRPRTIKEELCQEESPRRCHECFPEVSTGEFYMRKRYIQSHLGLVDCFIAPSEYVKHRYAEWGLPPERIEVEPQGFTPAGRREPDDETGHSVRNRFAFFGQLNPYKGADVLLRAMDVLGEDFELRAQQRRERGQDVWLIVHDKDSDGVGFFQELFWCSMLREIQLATCIHSVATSKTTSVPAPDRFNGCL